MSVSNFLYSDDEQFKRALFGVLAKLDICSDEYWVINIIREHGKKLLGRFESDLNGVDNAREKTLKTLTGFRGRLEAKKEEKGS